jgi:hypothetical protein
MRRTVRSTALIAISWAALFVSAPSIANDPLVYATIQPAQINLGESAQFTITNLGDGTNPISMPVVSGLRFEIIARTREIQIVNGNTLPSSSIVMRVTPLSAGIFSIPAVTPKAQPLVLQVNPARSGTPIPRVGAPPPPPPPPIFSGGSIPKGVHLTDDGSAYVRLNVPKRELYVGESVPVEIEVGMRSGFVSSLNGLPKLTGDDFALNNLSRQPERTEKLINGESFVLFTWRSVLAVIKPGTFALSAEAPLTVKVRTRSKQDSLLDDRFGDPFWQNFFGTTIPKDINVVSPPQEVKVLELPAEGRPTDFHGAIGNFSIASDISASKAEVGDPITLRMRITGSGSFDRVDSSMLDRVDQWKTYPPKSSFNTSDPIGFSGMKTFEQPVIASKPGVQTLPPLSFSYFDPTSRKYETARSAALSVTISPSQADSRLTPSQVAASAAGGAESKYAAGLRPDHPDSPATALSLVPPYFQPKLLMVPAFLVLAFIVAWIGADRRNRLEQGAKMFGRAPSKAAKRVLAQMEAAARAKNAALFFDLGRKALQRQYAARWQLAPDQITVAELEGRENIDDDVHQLFALADESKYSGRALKATQYVRWLTMVREQLLQETST